MEADNKNKHSGSIEKRSFEMGEGEKGDALMLPENFGTFRPLLYAGPVTC